MKIFINEVDRDYNTITNCIEKDFEDLASAEEWCKQESWSGYKYFINKSATESFNKMQGE